MSHIAKLPSCIYRVQIRKKGIDRSKTFTSKTEAAKWAANIEAAIESTGSAGLITVPRGTYISELIDAYAELEPKIKWAHKDCQSQKTIQRICSCASAII
jgi:hypothetical protein